MVYNERGQYRYHKRGAKLSYCHDWRECSKVRRQTKRHCLKVLGGKLDCSYKHPNDGSGRNKDMRIGYQLFIKGPESRILKTQSILAYRKGSSRSPILKFNGCIGEGLLKNKVSNRRNYS